MAGCAAWLEANASERLGRGQGRLRELIGGFK